MLSQMDWDIRHYLYEVFVDSEHPPGAREIAEQFDLSNAAAGESLRRLHDAHQIFLRPGG